MESQFNNWNYYLLKTGIVENTTKISIFCLKPNNDEKLEKLEKRNDSRLDKLIAIMKKVDKQSDKEIIEIDAYTPGNSRMGYFIVMFHKSNKSPYSSEFVNYLMKHNCYNRKDFRNHTISAIDGSKYLFQLEQSNYYYKKLN